MSLGVEVGGWFASACIAKLIKKVFSYVSDQYGYEANIKDQLKCLVEDLMKIQGVLHEADKRRIQNPALKQWLRNLKDASYEAEDTLDMFEYKILESKVEKTLDQVTRISARLVKHARTIAKRFSFLDDELKELNNLADRFRRITSDMVQLIHLISFEPTIRQNVHEIMQSRETTSLCTESQLFGRDTERCYLIEQLLGNGGVVSSKNVQVLPVVGIGGVGKTTLVQDVYNNPNVKNHFNLKAWVCVSDDFNVKRLAKETIESACIPKPQDFHNLENFDSIQDILVRGLRRKKYLFVLDDVWNEVARKWEMLQAMLDCGEKGSIVIVTTRSKKIADMMGTRTGIHLEGLLEDDYWRFFLRCAFRDDDDPKNYPSLELIGRQIAKKLGGNPLAAKTVGAVLKYGLSETHWREVLESNWGRVDQQEDGVMSVLKLSYDYLPVHLKQCFIYCSVFPQDYRFSVSQLARLWMAQGFLQSDQEEIGVEYFGELLGRSFFQEAKEFYHRYVIHDLLHSLAKQLSDGEISDAAEDRPIENSERARHVYVGAGGLSRVCDNEYLKKNLRSLVVSSCSGNSLEMLKELRGLRVLLLDGFEGELLPESIFDKMVHLRHLEIEGYERRCSHMLPKSLGMLYHIKFLRVGDWEDDGDIDGVLPEEIKRLTNLRHLDANTKGIAGIGTLTLLQELQFCVNRDGRRGGFEMRQLQCMSELRRLVISGLGRVESEQEASESMLGNLEHLKYLILTWEIVQEIHDGDDIVGNNEEVLEGLRPHHNLQLLHIYNYRGRRSPHWWNESWASRSYLQHVELHRCSNWEALPPFGLLPHLKSLKLLGMDGVKQIGSRTQLYGLNNNNVNMSTFPSLEELYVKGMRELREWWKVDDSNCRIELYPRVSRLIIANCPKLRGPLILPPQLKVLTVEVGVSAPNPPERGIHLRCEDALRLVEWVPLQNTASLEELRLLVRHMRRMPPELEEWFRHLTSLRSLSFEFCYELECLPYNLLNGLSSTLRKLSFSYCRSMESLPEEGLPPSLQSLNIDDCSYELATTCSQEWHKIAHIPNIIINGRVIQQQQRSTRELNTAMIATTSHAT